MSLMNKNLGRMVKIKDILQDNFKIRFGDYIKVRVICGQSIVTINDKEIARFIFADEENHISAVLYKIKSCPDSEQIYKNLMKMENRIICLSNFKIENNVPGNWRLLRDQSKRLILGGNCLQACVNIVEDESTSKFLKHFPFDFTSIADIETSEKDRVIDLIGFCKSHDVVVNPKHDHKKTTRFVNTRYNVYDEIPPYCNIEIFEKLKTEITRKDEVYALMNLEKIKYDGETIIRTTDNTFIVRVTDENRAKLPPDYESKTFIMNLLPKRRGPRLSNRGSSVYSKDWHNDKENSFLIEVSELFESPKPYIADYSSLKLEEPVKTNEPLKRRNSNSSAPKYKKRLCLESKEPRNTENRFLKKTSKTWKD